MQDLDPVLKMSIKGRRYYRFNKDEHIVRLHIGLEDPRDLINDLKLFEIHSRVMHKFFITDYLIVLASYGVF